MNKTTQKILGIITTSAIVLSSFPSYSEIPNSAKVTQILGANSMGIRRRKGGINPVAVGSIMQLLDKLDIPGTSGNIFALLEFFNKANQSMGLKIQAGIKNNLRTAYYFPCTANSEDTFIIEWTNPKNTQRGCQKGIKLSANNRPNAELLNHDNPQILASVNYLIGQNSPSQLRYCSVIDDQGKGWLGFSEYQKNPCEKPLEQCNQEGKGNCIEVTLDDWKTEEKDLTILVSCANQKEFSIKGTGENIKEQTEKLWAEVATKGATFCGLHIVNKSEAVVEPSLNTELSRVEINNSNSCLGFKVYNGEVTVRSGNNPDGNAVNLGQQYQYCPETQSEKKSTFDPTNESVDLQIFLAKSRNLEFCNQLQASGGQEGDLRTLQLTANEGVLRINYDMYGVPDQLRVIYENRELVNTGFVSGQNTLSIPFKGKSAQVTIEIKGNQEQSGTQWDYTLYCPQ